MRANFANSLAFQPCPLILPSIPALAVRRSTLPLPTELLSLIFLECFYLDLDDPSLECIKPSRTNTPLTLTWVCSHWRQVALSLPLLWTNIALESGSPPSHAAAQLLELYLSRSGDMLPLHFRLDYSKADYEEVNPSNDFSIAEKARREAYSTGMRRLAHILERVRLRWRFLAVSGNVIEALDDFLQSLVLGAPKLSYLLISTDSIDFGEQERVLNLERCPRLQCIVIHCPKLLLDPFTMPNLQHMYSLDLSWSQSQLDALVWLESCPNLEDLSIDFIPTDVFMQSNAFPLTLSHLTQFELELFCNGEDPSSFLDILSFPGLRNFTLKMEGAVQLGPENQWRRVIEFLQRSEGAPLEALELLGTPLNPQEFMEILQMTPGLRKLVFDGILATAEILDRLSGPAALTPSIDSEYEVVDMNSIRIPLCPKLETLELHNYSQPPLALADMALSRCQLSTTAQARVGGELSLDAPCYSTLKNLIFIGDVSPSPSNNPAFQACRDRGLRIIERCFSFQSSLAIRSST
ncbi:hypothetical protein EW145_g7091 [Phellinidium pouzarii]|uniref:Uncharacterized protein n=1 Tax=Phellinidium pouzarii TaxID=167371 RepID=A0A4S4KTR5_9AGAM|nr:hypothetical protein EW145_g7091 [Phellinidium pouzarii]